MIQLAAIPIHKVLENTGTPQTMAPGAEKNISVDADNSSTELVAVNTTDWPTRILLDTSGQTTTDVEGNVLVESPAFVGTGIMPEGTFYTCEVTNTADSGPGSLRDAINCANAAPASHWAVVTFAIAETDANFLDVDAAISGGDTDPDVFVISPLTTGLPALTRGMILINGQTQRRFGGDTNSFGPEIVLDGSQLPVPASGLHLASDSNQVHGLNIRSFTHYNHERRVHHR